MCRFGHAVRLDQRRLEHRLDLLNQLRRHRRRRRPHEAQLVPRQHGRVVLAARGDGQVHRGHGGVPGRLGLVHPRKEAQRVEPRRAEDARADRQRRQQASEQPVDVEQRHDVQPGIARRELQRVGDVTGRRAQVGHRKRHPFGFGRGARGVQHHGDIFGLGRAGVGASGFAGRARV